MLYFLFLKKQDKLDIIQVFKYIKHNKLDVATFFLSFDKNGGAGEL